MACFFTGCSFKGIHELPKVLLVHQRCQRHWQCMHCRCHWHRQRHVSPVSLTPAKLAIYTARCQWHRWCMTSPVSTTPVKCIAGVSDNGKCMLCQCHWHRRMHASPVSMTLVRIFLPVSLTPVKLFKTVKVSLPGVVDTGEELFTSVNDTGNATTPAKHRNNRISPRIFKKNRNRY